METTTNTQPTQPTTSARKGKTTTALRSAAELEAIAKAAAEPVAEQPTTERKVYVCVRPKNAEGRQFSAQRITVIRDDKLVGTAAGNASPLNSFTDDELTASLDAAGCYSYSDSLRWARKMLRAVKAARLEAARKAG